MSRRILAAVAAACLVLSPVVASGQTIGGGGGVSVPLTASCTSQSVAQLCFDATNVLSQRNGASPQEFDIYNTTDGTNKEYLAFAWASNIVSIFPAQAGTGSNRELDIGTKGAVPVKFFINNAYKWVLDASTGNFYANTDFGVTIGGQTTNRPLSVSAGFYSSQLTTQSGTSYTVSTGDSTIVLTSASTITLTLPAASSFTNRVIRVVTKGGGAVNSAGSNVVPLTSTTAGSTILAATAGKWAELQSDGANWQIIAGN